MRSGGSSLTCSTSIACVRAPDSSRPYASETNGSSEYDVSSFSATWFHDRLEAFGAAERRRRDFVVRQRRAAAAAGRRRARAPETPARGGRSACLRRSTLRATKLRDRRVGHPADDRAAPRRGRRRRRSPRCAEQRRASCRASSWPTAAAMLRSTGSSRSGSFFDTASTMPRSMRMSAAVFAPMPPAPSPLALERRHQLGEPLGVAGDAEQLADRLPRRARTRRPARQLAMTLVPRPRLRRRRARAALRRSRFRAARRAGRPSSSRRARCRRRRGPTPASRPSSSRNAAPRLDVAAGMDRQLADQVAVQQRRRARRSPRRAAPAAGSSSSRPSGSTVILQRRRQRRRRRDAATMRPSVAAIAGWPAG